MEFRVRDSPFRGPRPRGCVVLIEDGWDDWFKYSTMYRVVFVDAEGEEHALGDVKVGQFGMQVGQRRADLPASFLALDSRFFSLGQDAKYYENVDALGADLREQVLAGLRDIARDLELFDSCRTEDVTRVSLLRSVSAVTIRNQFHRLAQGLVGLTEYDFRYRAPSLPELPALALDFRVEPESYPPTNVHVLIGRNGVGKTRVLRLMEKALLAKRQSRLNTGTFDSERLRGEEQLFANVVSVSFSAFDTFEPVREERDSTTRVRYAYVGLQRGRNAEGKPQAPKSTRRLATEFVVSAEACRRANKLERWLRALVELSSDPLFEEAGVQRLTTQDEGDEWKSAAREVFDRLSSGHKIVLLTVTRLVEEVDERTLVLLDEPEGHLHPPLLAAFVRALSTLLVDRNGVAIIATHSPVVLQEVPRTCVWILRRVGVIATAERPTIETFGENVGVLNREAFGLEVTESGFHRLLQQKAQVATSYEQLVAEFDGQLGAEAAALARVLVAESNRASGA